MKKNIFFFVVILSLSITFSCKEKYAGIPEKYHALLDVALKKAGNNAVELEQALAESPSEEKEGMAFLISYMPDCDLDSISSTLLLNNCHYAYTAKNNYIWTKELPDSIFLNDVLPYCCLNEYRDDWRGDFYTRFSKYVKNCHTLLEAIDSVNSNVRDEVNVDYSTNRRKADQSPYESMEQNMASCSGLSILLTDAFRSVGIPARIAGTPLWYDKSGNHNWVEVWIDGEWYMTEYYPEGLNKGWVVAKAGNCDPYSRESAIYAASFRPAETTFPLVWDSTINWVYAENVSERYIELAHREKLQTPQKDNEMIVKVWFLKNPKEGITSHNRITQKIDFYRDTTILASGYTASETRDMNNALFIVVDKEQLITAKYKDVEGNEKVISFVPKDTDGSLILF